MTTTEAETGTEKITEEEEAEVLRGLVERELGDHYRNISLVNSGAQSFIYEAEWGPADEKRTIKVDRISIRNQWAKMLSERGCNTGNHVRSLAQLPEPGEHGIIPLLDYRNLQEEGVTLSVHPLIKGKTLTEIVSEKPLSREQIRGIFLPVVGAARYYTENGQVHRDLGPNNIIVQESTKKPFVLDFANAGKIDNLEAKILPTEGGRVVFDARTFSGFTGEEKAYSVGSDVWALGVDLYYSATGKFPFRINPEEGIFEDAYTGESLLNAAGKIDEKKFSEFIQRAKKRLPRRVRSLGDVVERAWSLDNPYKSVSEFESDLERATRPGLWERIKASGRSLGLGAAAAALAISIPAAAIVGNLNSHKATLEARAAEAEKYEIVSRFDGGSGQIRNNLFDLDFTAYDRQYNLIYGNSWRGSAERPAKISLERGMKLNINPKITMKPLPKVLDAQSFPIFDGAVYIEGWPAKRFGRYAGPSDSAHVDSGDFWGSYSLDIEYEVPNDVPDGSHTLVVEVYAHPDGTKAQWGNDALEHSRYKNPGRVLARLPVPVVVGKSGADLAVTNLSLYKFGGNLVINPSDRVGDIAKGLTYEVYIPDLGFRKRVQDEKNPANCMSIGLGGLPDASDDRERLMIVTAHDADDRCQLFTVYNIQADRTDDSHRTFVGWKVAPHAPDFPEKLIGHRMDAYRQFPEQQSSRVMRDALRMKAASQPATRSDGHD